MALDYATSVRDMAEFREVRRRGARSESRRISRILLAEAEKFRVALYRHEADHTCDRRGDSRNISETPPEPTAEPLSPYPLKPQPNEIPELSSQPPIAG